jgi:alpha-2-macroglobulin
VLNLAHRARTPAALLLLSVIIVPWLLMSCGRTKSGADQPSRPDPLWGQFLESHTTGVISRGADIRVIFATNVVPSEQVGKSATANFQVAPAVEGTATFVSTRELVFTPRRELAPGTTYKVSVNPNGLLEVPAKIAPFEFAVQVKRPEFEVAVDGLTVDLDAPGAMALTGTVVTADVEDTAKVEALVRATYLTKRRQLAWQHSADGQRHQFTIGRLERGAQETPLTLNWDGQPIGAVTSGEKKVPIPPRGRFVVTQVTPAESNGQRYIQVLFSEPLDTQQNLKGLVRLSQGNATVQREGNVLRVYSDEATQGEITLSLERGVRNRSGQTTESSGEYPVNFAASKPQVKFVGRGVILPEATTLSVPFEAVGVRSVRVTAFRVYDDNLTQFLQVNALNGSNELGRVGRNLWRKTIPLNATNLARSNRYNLDVTELMKKYPGGLLRLTLSVGREDLATPCAGVAPSTTQEPLADQDENDVRDDSNWDYAEDYYNVQDGSQWADRDNPCKDYYYTSGQQTKDSRNVLVSNLGLLAKKDQRGRWLVVASDLRTAQPLDGVRISATNFQSQTMDTQQTDARGMAAFTLKNAPFTFVATKDEQKGYLKVQQGVALPVSHFDIGGERVSAGLKGEIYGERGVWRPGDDLHLTFALQDLAKSLPASHPVTMELFNPQAQLVQTVVNTTPVNGFYAFTLKTSADAPTGNWSAKATLGGSSFTKALKIETVMPNRLKVALDLEHDATNMLTTAEAACAAKPEGCDAAPRIQGKLFGQWLSGASASGLKADVKMRLTPAVTQFDRNSDFIFEDPARQFAAEPRTLFEGVLDDDGNARIDTGLEPIEGAPGMLSAAFTSRIFERGGAFSISYSSYKFSPYARYVGLKLPKGDAARNMLMTDTKHTVEIAGLTAAGKPANIKRAQVSLYKVEWKWWWDKSGESLAQYVQGSSNNEVEQSAVALQDGKGQYQFEIKYPAWGRYLLRVCDMDGGHCAGQTFYIDWPSWAGRAQDQSGPAANALIFTADKPKYQVGDTATLQLPESKEGRALLTIENGSAILDARWIDFSKDSNRVKVPITAAMAPNVYASVTLIQPHARSNDRPLRLYGVIPLFVSDPQTVLTPVIDVAKEWRPESAGVIEVSERNQRPMTYTLAVVDEGLLDLTSFKTPNLHERFYQREALGVSSWDLFDEVAGANSAQLERLLAIGGSDGPVKNSDERKTRFPPVVTFIGPFQMKGGEKQRHTVQLPQYIGAVRVMVVAGQTGAYGSAEKSVFVRQPLMLLPTLPRVLGPEEEVAVPVSVFSGDPSIKSVTLKMAADAAFEIVGSDAVQLEFRRPEEQIGMLRIRSKPRVGQGKLSFSAVSGQFSAKAQVYLDVRSPNPPTTVLTRRTLEAGESWSESLVPHGLAGTNTVTLEVSAVPPLDLERRLQYLVTYPYGCLEQTTSGAFPQVFLTSLLKLDAARRAEIQRNVQSAIQRLGGFQLPNGAFAYWPGGFVSGDYAIRDQWSTTYAGHFLLEAKKAGYAVPEAMLSSWTKYQRSAAQSWNQSGENEAAAQAYRLYTLALATQPDVGAMNRLRERQQLTTTARWMLAASYKLAGLTDAAEQMAKGASRAPESYNNRDRIFGSDLRDRAIVLNALVTLGRTQDAQAMADELSRSLIADQWYSTQSTAYALLAMSHYVGAGQLSSFTFKSTVNGKATSTTVESPLYSAPLAGFPDRGAPVRIDNTAKRRLFATLATRGVPAAGTDSSGNAGLALQVEYKDEEGRTLDVARLAQGSDLIARLTVSNTTAARIDNIALAQLVPAGWEIHNERLEGVDATGEREQSEAPKRWWLEPSGSNVNVEHVDIRDDRIYRHFSLKPGERLVITTRLNAAYRGRFYLPSIAAEAMYDAALYAREKGQWVEVVSARASDKL